MSNALHTIAPVTRVRVAANPQAEVVAELPSGTEVEVLSRRDAFLQISAWHRERGRVAGWVHKSFIGGQASKFADALPSPEGMPAVTVRCQACSGENWAVVTYMGSYGIGSTPYVSTGLLDGIEIKARVCRSCGLVQLCLDSEGLARLERWFNRT